MTVTQAYIAKKHYDVTLPSINDIPASTGQQLITGISVNSAYTSKILVHSPFIYDIFYSTEI